MRRDVNTNQCARVRACRRRRRASLHAVLKVSMIKQRVEKCATSLSNRYSHQIGNKTHSLKYTYRSEYDWLFPTHSTISLAARVYELYGYITFWNPLEINMNIRDVGGLHSTQQSDSNHNNTCKHTIWLTGLFSDFVSSIDFVIAQALVIIILGHVCTNIDNVSIREWNKTRYIRL